nr:YadA-like family protein [Xanthomonas massiliensis]
MNRVYRLVWNTTLNALVVASELARSDRPAGAAMMHGGTALSRPARLAAACSVLVLAMQSGHALAADNRLSDLASLIDKYAEPSATAAPASITPAAAVAPASVQAAGGSARYAASAMPSVVQPGGAARGIGAATSSPVVTTGSNASARLATVIASNALAKAGTGAAAASAGLPAVVSGVVGTVVRPAVGITTATVDGVVSKTVGGLTTALAGSGSQLATIGNATVALVDTATDTLDNAVTTLATGTPPAMKTNELREDLVNLVGETATGAEHLVTNVLDETHLDEAVEGVGQGASAVVGNGGQLLAGAVGGITGSDALAGTVGKATGALADGLTGIVGNVVNTDVNGLVGAIGGTVDTVAGQAVGGVATTVGGLVGSSSGLAGVGDTVSNIVDTITDGLGNVVGSLTGQPASTTSSTPKGLTRAAKGTIVSNGGIIGSVEQLVDPLLESVLGGDGWLTDGSMAVNSANIQKAYSTVNVLGLPVANLSPVGQAIDALGGAATGGNSHLTLIGGVTSDSYITNVNSGNPGGLLGLLLPDGSPAYATNCLNVLGLVTADCWAVNAAQDYQTLIGEGASANGSKEVVIGSNASHTLASVDARDLFTGGYVDGDYDARLGHSVVVGDSASGTANGQTILGAEAISDQANSVALGYKSNADRGALAGYAAYGLAAAQTSSGEVSIGQAGAERQITHLAAGSEDTDAVNVGQLKGAISQIDAVSGVAVKYDLDANGDPDYGRATLEGASGTVIGNVAAGVAADEAVNVVQLRPVVESLGGGATMDPATGAVTGPAYVLDDGNGGTASYSTVGGALENLDGRVGSNTTNIENIINGTAGLVRQDPGSLVVTVAGQSGGTVVDFGNVDGEGRRLTGVADAEDDDDAVNLAQLKAVAGDVTLLGSRAVQYDVDADGNVLNHVTLSGDGSGAAVGISNVAAGTVAAGSTDAVNGAQLYDTNGKIAEYLGGGAGYDGAAGTWTGPTYTITQVGADGSTSSGSYGSVGDAFGAVNSSLVNINTQIDQLQAAAADSKYLSVESSKAGAEATGSDSLAIGPEAKAEGAGSVAVGSGAHSSADAGVALGEGATVDQANSVALGAGSSTSVGAQTGYDGAYVEGTSNSAGEVSVGSDGAERKVTHVADGSDRYDAVNVGQLQGGVDYAITQANAYTDQQIQNINGSAGMFQANDSDGKGRPTASGDNSVAGGAGAVASGNDSTALGNGALASADNSVAVGAGSVADRANSVSVGSEGNYRQVTNIAAGTADNDAVNVQQMNQGLAGLQDWSKNYTDQRFSQINRDINRVDNRAMAGVASAMAVAGLPQAYLPGHSMASAAVGGYNGEAGMAVGISGVSEGGRWIYKLSGTTNTRGDGGVSVGLGIQW